MPEPHGQPEPRSARCVVLTVSDTRTPDTDESGPLAARLLETSGHEVVQRRIVPDDPEAISETLDGWLDDAGVDAVVLTGGTGIAPRDRTIEVVRRVLTVEIEGFGELFRMLSYERVGSASMLSRAVGGLVVRGTAETFVFAVPGAPDAVETAVAGLIGPELGHLVGLRRA